jgi:DNA polymerase-3 subunit beta
VEQLNIVGKRSGEGFIAHKAMLVNALSRALSERVTLMDFTIGRRGFIGYLKALAGSNIVKVVPANGSASGSQANGHKRLKITCGANTSYLDDLAWIKTEGKRITPLTICEVRVSPNNTVKPNIGSLELAEALNRVLPFTATDDARPILQCVNLVAKEGKLTLVSADGFRLAVITLDYDGQGQALINRDDLKGIANALKRAKRVSISFESEDVTKPSSLILDTELIRYKWVSNGGQYPDYEKLIPNEFNTYAHFDTVEATKAISSLKALSDSKSYPIDLTIGDGKIVLANPDDKGQTDIPADTNGQGYVRIDGKYLADVLKACGGMVDFSLSNAVSPTLFSADGYKVVVMPMITEKAQKEAKAKQEVEAKATEPEPAKPKAKRAKQPVTAK